MSKRGIYWVMSGVCLFFLSLLSARSFFSPPSLLSPLSSSLLSRDSGVFFSQEPVVASGSPTQRRSLVSIDGEVREIVAENSDLTVSVVFDDISSGEKISINETTQYHAASTAKLMTAAYFLLDVQNGQRNLSDTIGLHSASYHMEQLITQSNNDSWDTLNRELKLGRIQAFSRHEGMETFDVYDNTIFPQDMAIFLRRLFSRHILDETQTTFLLSLMRDTNEERFIPPALPDGVGFFHKTGVYEGNIHDVAILTREGHAAVLVIYTKGNDGIAGRAGVFHDITRVLMRGWGVG